MLHVRESEIIHSANGLVVLRSCTLLEGTFPENHFLIKTKLDNAKDDEIEKNCSIKSLPR